MSLIAVGQPFPALPLPDLEGRTHPLDEAWAAGAALIAIGHRDCKTTRQTLPYVDRIHRRRGPGVGVRAVLQDDVATAREVIDELGLELPVRLEPSPYPLAEALGIVTVPTLFAVDASGRIASIAEGFNRAALEALAQLLGATPPLFAPDDKSPAMRPG